MLDWAISRREPFQAPWVSVVLQLHTRTTQQMGYRDIASPPDAKISVQTSLAAGARAPPRSLWGAPCPCCPRHTAARLTRQPAYEAARLIPQQQAVGPSSTAHGLEGGQGRFPSRRFAPALPTGAIDIDN